MTSGKQPYNWRRLTGPLALAGRVEGGVVAVACLLALALIFVIERLTSPSITVGALSFIPVLVAVWLLSGRWATAVTLAAVVLRIAAIFLDGIHPLTVATEVVTITAVAGLGRLAAGAVSAYWGAEALGEERKRIARELHDGTIQSLFGIGIDLRTTGARSRDPSVRTGIHEAVREIDGVIRDLRNYVAGLRPLTAVSQPLGQALEELSQDLEAKTRIRCLADIDYMVAAQLASRSTDVIQLTREALSNVGRHSAARNCRLSLRREGGAALLEVHDDGRGFDVGRADGSGHGLRNLRERAAVLEGDASIASGDGRGTTVRIVLPLTELAVSMGTSRDS